MLRSYCFRCGGPQENPSALLCNACTAAGNEAHENVMQSGREQIEAETDLQKKQWMQDVLEQAAAQARKDAVTQRAHHANRNFVDPRSFSSQGMIPKPPQSGDRGGPV